MYAWGGLGMRLERIGSGGLTTYVDTGTIGEDVAIFVQFHVYRKNKVGDGSAVE